MYKKQALLSPSAEEMLHLFYIPNKETRCLPINEKFSSSIWLENPKRYWPQYKILGITKAIIEAKDKLNFEQCVQVTLFSLFAVISSQNFLTYSYKLHRK